MFNSRHSTKRKPGSRRTFRRNGCGGSTTPTRDGKRHRREGGAVDYQTASVDGPPRHGGEDRARRSGVGVREVEGIRGLEPVGPQSIDYANGRGALRPRMERQQRREPQDLNPASAAGATKLCQVRRRHPRMARRCAAGGRRAPAPRTVSLLARPGDAARAVEWGWALKRLARPAGEARERGAGPAR